MLEIKGLTYNIGHKKLLDNISTEVNQGEIVVIIGANGAGKTTLLKHISGEIESSEQVIFKNKTIEQWAYQEKAKHMAVFSQHNAEVIPLPVEEIVLMGRYPYFDNYPTEQDLKIVHKNIEKTDITTFKNQPYDTLSGGEKQRTHLARVFSQLDNNGVQQKLLLLDEPFNNLDVYHQYKIMNRVREFVKNNNTAIIVLHDLNVAGQFADSIILLKNGKLLGKGTPEEILTKTYIEQAYDFPCEIIENPVSKTPMVIFVEKKNNN